MPYEDQLNPIVFEFLEATKPQRGSQPPEALRLPQPPLELPAEGARIDLPAPAGLTIPSIELRQAVEQRRSLRRYSPAALSLDELSYLLWMTQGVKEITSRPATLRTVPSAGARHAFETYLLVNRVTELKPGLYRFVATEHQLTAYNLLGNVNEAVTQACYGQKQVQNSAVAFLWSAVAARMAYRYTERGFRYLFLDAGHVCQNLSLAAEAIGAGVCAIAAYDDDALNAALRLDGREQWVIYLAALGKKPE